jgi:hypothetical protein
MSQTAGLDDGLSFEVSRIARGDTEKVIWGPARSGV